MHMQRSRHLALDQYRHLQLSSRLHSANGHELVTILYETLDLALETAIKAYADNQTHVMTVQLGRARSILTALEAGLDRAKGGTLAETLGVVYRSMQRRLSDVTEYPAAMEDVRSGLADMAGSWSVLSQGA